MSNIYGSTYHINTPDLLYINLLYIAHDKWPGKLGHPTSLVQSHHVKYSYAIYINLQPHDHWESSYMDISIRHRKNGGRIWDCLFYLDSTNSPAGKTPLLYSEDHQEKWVQSLAHILHCDMQWDL